MNRARSHRRAFTLIEIMLVVAIMGIALAMSYPAISNIVHRAPLSQSVQDVMEGCRKARAMAILQGVPMELRIDPSDGSVSVMNAPADADTAAAPAFVTQAPAKAVYEGDQPKSAGAFSAQISSSVRIELLDVNFVEYKDLDVARVRFNPNGTSDEFTMILSSEGEFRQISLEVVTGLAEVESDHTKFGRGK